MIAPHTPNSRAQAPAADGQQPCFEHDLDERLCYRRGTLALTGMRLRHLEQANGCAPEASWDLTPEMSATASAYTGVGEIELRDSRSLLGRWHYTIGLHADACAFVKALNQRALQQDEGFCDSEPTLGQHITSESGLDAPDEITSRTTMKSFGRLVAFCRPWTRFFLLSFVLSAACTAAGMIPPYITMPLIDKVLIPFQNGQPVDQGRVVFYLSALCGAAFLAWLLGWARTYVLAWVSERVSAGLRNSLYTHLHRLSLDYFSEKRTGDLIARVSTDTDRICFFLSVYVLDLAADILMITMTAAILFYINPLLAAVTLLPFPFIFWLTHRVRETLRRGFSKGSRAWADMTSVLADAIPGVRVVKAFAQEKRETGRFQEANRLVLRANDRINRIWSFFGPLVTLFTDLGVLIIWAFAVWMIFKGRITVGVLTAFVAYISKFYGRLEAMIRMVSAFQRTAASVKRIFDVIDIEPRITEAPKPVVPGRITGKIEFRDVGFSYGTRDVLKNVSLSIAPGEMIGFVGPSGSGKTTLVNLVCRFYDVCAGAVLVDGIDVREMSLAAYRKNIGIVLQEPFLFYGTIAENIAYGRPEAAREEIIEAARAACAHDFIIRLPDAYDTLVGERGQLLSGGERQRISIARAILINPAILILDEATSSVDVETEKEIQQAVENLVQGRTTLAVAHRLSTLKRADRIVVLEEGAITGVGKHEELLQTSMTYAKFHRTSSEMYLAGSERPLEALDAKNAAKELYADYR